MRYVVVDKGAGGVGVMLDGPFCTREQADRSRAGYARKGVKAVVEPCLDSEARQQDGRGAERRLG